MNARINAVSYAIVVLLGSLSASSSAVAANASGSYSGAGVFGDHPFQLTIVDAYAYRVADKNADSKEATIVILSDKPIDAVALTATSTYRDMAAQDAFRKSNAGYVILKFDGAQLVSVTAAGAGGESSGIGGGLKASIKTNDGHRIEGHCCEVSKTLKNVTADFEFALPVVAAVAGS